MMLNVWIFSSPVQPALRAFRDRVDHAGGVDVDVGAEIEGDHRQQHQHAAEECIQEKLDGCILTPRTTPDADEEVHREEHHFPEDVEQEEVQRHEDAHHARIEKQEERRSNPSPTGRSSTTRSSR